MMLFSTLYNQFYHNYYIIYSAFTATDDLCLFTFLLLCTNIVSVYLHIIIYLHVGLILFYFVF